MHKHNSFLTKTFHARHVWVWKRLMRHQLKYRFGRFLTSDRMRLGKTEAFLSRL